jgi:glycerate dehydrogenase
MNIVVLDAYTLNPGDLSWDSLDRLGRCTIYDRTPPAKVVSRSADAEIVLTNKVLLDRNIIGALPKLRYIGVLATGTNVVDLAAARERGITVTNVPAYGTASVAQTTIALLLELTQRVGHHSATVMEGRWSKNPDWCYWDFPLMELEGLQAGIIGLGHIGQAVARITLALGMKVSAFSHSSKKQVAGIELLDLETLIRRSDVLSLHCPLTEQTRNLINAERLSWMKPAAILLNTSRGALIDEAALADALNSGRLAGAGLDVLSVEPPPANNPLLTAKNCIITPHLAWATKAARSRLMAIAVENAAAFLSGKPKNVVNR